MPTLSVTTKKPAMVVRTFAADLERVRSEQAHPSAPPVLHTTPVPKIGLRHNGRSTHRQQGKAVVSQAQVSTPPPITTPQTIKLKKPEPIPKPIIVTPTKSASTIVQPTAPLTALPNPSPRSSLPASPVIPLHTLPESNTTVRMGDDSTNEQATIITDTKHKRFKASSSIWNALETWWRGIRRKKSHTASDQVALPAASARQSVIKRATTLSGTTATARDTTLTKRVQNRPHENTPLPSISTVNPVPEQTPEIPHQRVTWTANTEPSFPLLGTDTIASPTEEPTPSPVVVVYKQFARPTPPSVQAPTPQSPVIVVPRTTYVPPDPDADKRWGVAATEPATPVDMTLIAAEIEQIEHTLPGAQPITASVSVATRAPTQSEPQKATLPSVPQITPRPVVVTNSLTRADQTQDSVPLPTPEVASEVVTPTVPTDHATQTEPIPPEKPPATQLEVGSAAQVDTPPVLPAYTKRLKRTPSVPSLIHRVRALILQGDTNILTLIIVGVVVGVSVLGVGIWLLIRALIG